MTEQPGSAGMPAFHAVLTRRDGEATVLSIFTADGHELERRLSKTASEAHEEIAWAGRVFRELNFEQLTDWRASTPFDDETVHEVRLRLPGTNP